MSTSRYPSTPDGRYFVASGRLWRCTDPRLDENTRKGRVSALMTARREVRNASTETERKQARSRVHQAKIALGERGPVWWNDGAADETRRAPKNSSYAEWWARLSAAERAAGGA